MVTDFDFYEPDPNWKTYVDRAKAIGIDNGMTHLIVVGSWDDPEDQGHWFHFADNKYGTYNQNSGVIEKRCENGGGIVRAIIELGDITRG